MTCCLGGQAGPQGVRLYPGGSARKGVSFRNLAADALLGRAMSVPTRPGPCGPHSPRRVRSCGSAHQRDANGVRSPRAVLAAVCLSTAVDADAVDFRPPRSQARLYDMSMARPAAENRSKLADLLEQLDLARADAPFRIEIERRLSEGSILPRFSTCLTFDRICGRKR